MPSDADISRDLPGLIDGDKEARIIGEFQRKYLALASVSGRELLKTQITADAMLGMNDQVTLCKLREVDRRS